jgi:outer membrane biosynthesis protein TonB
VIIGVVWAGIRMFGTKPPSQAATDTVSVSRPDISDAEQAAVPPEPTESAPGVQGSPGGSSSAGISGRPNASAPTRGKSAANTRAAARAVTAAPGAPSVAIQEVLPDVPPRSRRTIRGHVRVSVRLIVEQDGTVFAALAEQRGPSRYFERLAIDAAKKWTFTPSDSEAQRLMLVKFDFTRDGATADAVPLN